jgi:hypothetical protein
MSSSESTEKTFIRYVDEPPINTSTENFFAKYASIPPSALRNHLITTRERAWKNFNYTCLGRWTFLDFSIQRSPIYKEIIEKCKNEGATVIDFGCCLGQDVRQLVYDGVRCRKCKNGAKFCFCSIIHGWIELVELIKNISFLICFDHVLAEKFSKYLVHPKK